MHSIIIIIIYITLAHWSTVVPRARRCWLFDTSSVSVGYKKIVVKGIDHPPNDVYDEGA